MGFAKSSLTRNIISGSCQADWKGRAGRQGLFSMLNPQQLVGMDNYGPMYEQVVSITALEMMMLCCL